MSGFCAILWKDSAVRGEAQEAERLLAAATPSGSPAPASASDRQVAVAACDPIGGKARRFVHQDEDLLVVCDAELYRLPGGAPGAPVQDEAKAIAELYSRLGDKWWSQVHGVFSVFIWDKKARLGKAFTDRLGSNPIVYHNGADRLVVASSIRSIAATPGFRKEIEPQALHSFMEMAVIPTPFTLYKGVSKLEGGHFLEIRPSGGVQVKPAWEMVFPPEKLRDEAALCDRTYELLRSAVGMQAIYRNPIEELGCFLSGGTDSSSIAGLVEELFPGKARTFSIGFDEAGYDEMEYARIAAKAFRTIHTEYYVTPADIIEGLPIIAKAYDEPFANSSAIPAYFCARLARDHGVKVMLGGDGGDEIFGGNERYADLIRPPVAFAESALGNLAGKALRAVPEGLKGLRLTRAQNRYFSHLFPVEDRIHFQSLHRYLPMDEVFTRDFTGRGLLSPEMISRRYIQAANTPDPVDSHLFHDLKITLMDNDLRKVNVMAEIAGIHVRYPFLDFELIEFTGLIPPELKVKDGKLRYLFKQSMKRLLPDAIINKQKHGFGLPVVRWMLRKGPLNDLLKATLFDGRLKNRGIFRDGFVEKLYTLSQNDRTTYYGSHLYYIFVLETWLRTNLDGTQT